tara:strand:+ start:263 stop:580 length:318 start_codon:yes stop_codon:yes gene_type:complete
MISIGAIPASLLRWHINDTFIVNIIGCFLLGFINNLSIPKRYKFIFGFAFCGSLTTFSGWIFQLFNLLSEGLYLKSLLNVILIILISFLAVLFGNLFAKKLRKLS